MSTADRLAEYVLGTLDADEASALDALLRGDGELRREHDALADTVAQLAQVLPPLSPSPGARARLLEAVSGHERHAPFVDRLCTLFDLGRARVRSLLAAMDDAARWEPGPCPGVQLMHFEAGPAACAFDAGFVRMPAGTHFPAHLHLGHEVAIVLEGAYREAETATLVRAGELVRRDAGSAHTLEAVEDLLFAVVLGADIEFKPT